MSQAENVLHLMSKSDGNAGTMDGTSLSIPIGRSSRPRSNSAPSDDLKHHLKAIQEEAISVKWSSSFEGPLTPVSYSFDGPSTPSSFDDLTPGSSNLPIPRSTRDVISPISKREASQRGAMWNVPVMAWGPASGSESEPRTVDRPLNGSRTSPPSPAPVAGPPALPGKTFEDVINPPSPMPAPRRIRITQRPTR